MKILVENDMHCGNICGLNHPLKYTRGFESVQAAMHDWRKKQLDAIGEVDIHVLNGDLVDGPGKKETMGHWTTDTDEQAEVAEDLIREVKARHRFFTYGTPFHVTTTGNIERSIAKSFGCSISDTVQFSAHGVKFKFRHVAGRSDTPYGQGTQILKEIARDQLQSILDDHESADVHGRAHVHYWSRCDVKGKIAFTAPAWELPLDFAGSVYPRKLRTMYYDVGFVYIEVLPDKEVIIRPRIMPLKGIVSYDFLEVK